MCEVDQEEWEGVGNERAKRRVDVCGLSIGRGAMAVRLGAGAWFD